jgi:hypothetical protein
MINLTHEGTVPILNFYYVGTVLTLRLHKIRTVPMFLLFYNDEYRVGTIPTWEHDLYSPEDHNRQLG